MITAYRGQQWDQATDLIVTCRDLAKQTNGEAHGLAGLNVLYDLYDERIAAYRADPPGADWDGVFVATSK
jgi:adenylate cyclase